MARRAEGTAILFTSADLDEIVTYSDRILVFHEGRGASEVGRKDFSEETIMRLATATAEVEVPVQ